MMVAMNGRRRAFYFIFNILLVLLVFHTIDEKKTDGDDDDGDTSRLEMDLRHVSFRADLWYIERVSLHGWIRHSLESIGNRYT